MTPKVFIQIECDCCEAKEMMPAELSIVGYNDATIEIEPDERSAPAGWDVSYVGLGSWRYLCPACRKRTRL